MPLSPALKVFLVSSAGHADHVLTMLDLDEITEVRVDAVGPWMAMGGFRENHQHHRGNGVKTKLFFCSIGSQFQASC